MKIISGGQTGVDRAALDAAIALGVCTGGWVPKGGWAEDFPDAPGLLGTYPQLREAATSAPAERTRLNVRESDATLILLLKRNQCASPGTRLTEETARNFGRPLLFVRVDESNAAYSIRDWLRGLGDVNVLNIAGPRESEAPGIYARSREVLETALAEYAQQ